MIKIILVILLSEIFATIGQVYFKKAVDSVEPAHMKTLKSYTGFLKGAVFTPAMWISFVMMAVSLIVWLFVLASADLSLVFPINSIQYILILIAARVFLKERLDNMKIAGTLLIVAGIIFLTMS